MTTMITSRGELDRLPLFATVYDHMNQVYQKLPTHNAKGEGWFSPGDTRCYSAAIIELSARVL